MEEPVTTGVMETVSTRKLWIQLLIRIGIIAAVTTIVLVFVLGVHVNHGNQMYPSLRDGDLCFTNKLTSYVAADAVAYEYQGTNFFGRVVAVGGDTIDIADPGIIVNGSRISEQVVYPTTADDAQVQFPYQVPEGHVFILNDFREDGNDSRAFGALPTKDLKGKVVLIMRKRGI